MKIKNNYFVLSTVILAAVLSLNSVNADVVKEQKAYSYPVTTKQEFTISAQPIDNLVGHYNNKIEAVFSDIDGTLIPLERGMKSVVPQSVKNGYQKLKQANIPLFLVTGRSCWEAREIAKRIGAENTYLITQQGTQIINPQGQMIFEDNINHKDSVNILKNIDLFKKMHQQDSKIFFFVNGKPYATEKFTLPYILDELVLIKSVKDLPTDFTLNKIGIYDNNPKNLVRIQSYLEKKYPNYHIVISADCYCDISSKKSTKGTSVKMLAEKLNINLKNTAVFGDAENDISMLSLIKNNGGLAIAVGNAMPALKSNANFITTPVYDNGFANAVNKILENNAILEKKCIKK